MSSYVSLIIYDFRATTVLNYIGIGLGMFETYCETIGCVFF